MEASESGMTSTFTRHLTASTVIEKTDYWFRERNLIRHKPGLPQPYETLGYSPHTEIRARTLVDKSLSLVDFDIQDLTAFKAAVFSVVAGSETVDDKLVQRLKKVALNREEIKKSLGDKLAHMNRQCHFSFSLDLPKQVTDLISVKVISEESLKAVLDELQSAIEYGPQPQSIQSKAISAIDTVRQHLSTPVAGGDIRAELERMADCIHDVTTVCCHDDSEKVYRKSLLDDVISSCEGFRKDFCDDIKIHTVGFVGAKELVQKAAKLYVDSNWMHNPPMTGYVASCLIDTEIAPYVFPEASFFDRPEIKFVMLCGAAFMIYRNMESWAGWIILAGLAIQYLHEHFPKHRKWSNAIWQISEELDSGCYDGRTLAHRLREWEGKGYRLNSLVYPLLEIPSTQRQS